MMKIVCVHVCVWCYLWSRFVCVALGTYTSTRGHDLIFIMVDVHVTNVVSYVMCSFRRSDPMSGS